MDTLKSAVLNAIDRHADSLNRLSQEIWNHPEENYQEHHAHKVLTNFLEKQGFQVEREYKLSTAFRAEYGDSGSGPNIAVLCEYDALPVIGHACGHNLIAEVGIAAGLGIKAAMEKANRPFGKLTVFGTPAEETGGGKIDLINGGAFEDIDLAMMAHPGPFNLAESNSLCIADCTVKYHGKASHASGFPWEGVNALDAAVLCYSSISCLRQQFKPTWRVHGVITNGGAKPNIIPELTQLDYYIRAPSPRELQDLKGKIIKCIESAATATGCTVDCEFEENEYLSVLNNQTLVKLYVKHATDLGVEFVTDRKILDNATGSTDMGNVSHVVPGIHPEFYIGSPTVYHTPEFTTAAGSPAAQSYTLNQGKALALTALDVYNSPETLAKVKDDFLKDKKANS